MGEEIKDQLRDSGRHSSKLRRPLSWGGGCCKVAEGLHSYGWESVPIVAVETAGAASLMPQKKPRSWCVFLVLRVVKKPGACQATKLWNGIRSIRFIPLTVSDKKCVRASRTFCNEIIACLLNQHVLSIAVVYLRRYLALRSSRRQGPIVVIVCGGGMVDLDAIAQWKSMVSTQVDDITRRGVTVALLIIQGALSCFTLSTFTNWLRGSLQLSPGPDLCTAYYASTHLKLALYHSVYS